VKPSSVLTTEKSSSNVKVAAASSSSASYFSSLGAKKIGRDAISPTSKKIATVSSASKIPTYKYETVIEVVRDSKRNRSYNNRPNNNFVENKIWSNNKKDLNYDGGSEGGGTFADLIKVSENRKNKRDKKRK
jgi:hypothetical protein